MKTITQEIQSGKLMVSDGAWGTFLQQMGLQPGECPESWNLKYPDRVLEIAQSYIDAGSDMIETNSFGGNAFKLSMFGLEDKVYEINEAAARISRKAAGSNRHVLGSIGPTGKMLMMGDVTYEQLYEAFKTQAMGLEAGGADALVVETMTDLEEATAAVRACRDNTSCEVICTMTFDKSPDGSFFTMMGVSPADLVPAMIDAGANIIGANCGNGMENMIGIVNEIRAIDPEIPVLVHANAGAPVYKNGETVFLETPDQMAQFTPLLIDAGANIIGGCCGTTPDHIRKIVEVVKLKTV
ncbi:MAG: homocysteine S-methyltransferase family protein [Prolixibacteraceae bacterium]|nr:homocysteine S-methyltransferase family protein [Prolixibacteraceae bacterium]MBN2649275.1 homocysteine S-methyltransferase family protein [Prolixibacteraceae bacterium]